MLIETRCADCGRTYQVPPVLEGRRVRCRACQGVFRVTRLEAGAAASSGEAGYGVAGPVKINLALLLILAGYLPSLAYRGYVLVEQWGASGLLSLVVQVCLLLLVAVPLGALGLCWAGKLAQFRPPEPVYLAVLATFAVPVAIMNLGGVLTRMTGGAWWGIAAALTAIPLTYLVLSLFNRQGAMRDSVGFALGVVAPAVALTMVVLVGHSVGGRFFI